MTTTAVQIVSVAGQPIARADVELADGVWRGDVDGPLGTGSAADLFARYERAVNDQLLGITDGLEDEIAGLGAYVLFPDGQSVAADDLQIYPTTRHLSSRLREAAATTPDAA